MFTTSHLHPMLVHFPIALIAIGFAANFVHVFIKKGKSFSVIGFYLLIVGTLTALATLLTGVFLTSEMTGSAGEVRDSHELFAWITVILLIVTLAISTFVYCQEDPKQPFQVADFYNVWFGCGQCKYYWFFWRNACIQLYDATLILTLKIYQNEKNLITRMCRDSCPNKLHPIQTSENQSKT